MNYQRIYTAFIADRRAKESALKTSGAYSEKHHILPAAKGGSDLPENLIRLTPEDHFFAHLLLAKIYGGKMWLAVVLMTASHQMCYGERRRLHGFAARAAQKDKAPDEATKAKMLATQQAKAPRISFVNLETKEQFTGTTFEFRNYSGLHQRDVSKLATRRLRVSKGWALLENKDLPRGGYDLTIRIFKHKDGRQFTGTAYQFRNEFQVDAGLCSRLIKQKHNTRSLKGWRYAGEKET